MDLPVNGVCINFPPKQDPFALLAAKHEEGAVEANLPLRGTYVRYFAVYFERSVGYDMKSVRLTEDATPAIFEKLDNDKPKQISILMEKLNRKRVIYER